MTRAVDYYLSLNSPWTYLGSRRLEQILAKHGAIARVMPVDFGRIFPASGGLPLAKRAPQRQAYRLMELRRWREHLGVRLSEHPKHFPVPERGVALAVVAARATHGDVAAMALAHRLLEMLWAEDRNTAEDATIAEAARDAGIDGNAILAAAASAETRAAYDAQTDDALERGVFGAPSYVLDGEIFWGQDRLDFLDRALARG